MMGTSNRVHGERQGSGYEAGYGLSGCGGELGIASGFEPGEGARGVGRVGVDALDLR